jgi:dsDNA-specific endonuclease/ATPase MutS2
MIFDFVLRLIRPDYQSAKEAKTSSTGEDDDEAIDPDDPFPDPVTIEFRDVIDLHSIPAKQTRAVVEDYLEEARRRGVRFVRFIHGKGVGVQREIVRSILERTPSVVDFRDAPAEAGGWGATIVTLRVDEKSVD